MNSGSGEQKSRYLFFGRIKARSQSIRTPPVKSSFHFDSLSIPVEHQVRMTTLNTLHAKTAVEERTSLLCAELQEIEPDILCLQEVRFEQDGSSLQLKNIAHETNLKIATSLSQTPPEYPHKSGTAILSTLPVLESGSFSLQTPNAIVKEASYAVLEHTTGKVVIAITAHLHWGGDKERERVKQVTAINREAKAIAERYSDLRPIIMLDVDFNTLPESDSMRFLKGLGSGSDDSYTYWTDAWETHGTPENEVTVSNKNHWAQHTARAVGIRLPHMMPDRRIDYIMSMGWNHGKDGTVLQMSRSFENTGEFGYTASDHYGLTADFWAAPILT
jgi:endonuclease/exonuclease/phosphatase family metal-dependent hydrolase